MITLTILLTCSVIFIVIGLFILCVSYPEGTPGPGCFVVCLGLVAALMAASYFIGTLHALSGH